MINDVEIIISRYNENLNWTLEHPFNIFNYIVYNKSINNDFEKKYVSKIIELNNVGKCDHTYLYHIVKNYDNLKKITVFFPGSIDMPTKKNKAIKILNNIIESNYTTAYFIGKNIKTSLSHEFKDFKMDNYVTSYPNNKLMNDKNLINDECQKCNIRPYDKWYRYFFGKTIVKWYTYMGIFSIDKKDIIHHSIDRYKILLEIVSLSINPEVGHYIERSWCAIFHPLIYTKKIEE
jgi:hypothetical protein